MHTGILALAVATLSLAPTLARADSVADNPYLAESARDYWNPAGDAIHESGGMVLDSLRNGIARLPVLNGASLLPDIRKVYPTGEKPLMILSFRCPAELVGIAPPPIKLLHGAIDLGMQQLNRTDLLSFNLQQVCS